MRDPYIRELLREHRSSPEPAVEVKSIPLKHKVANFCQKVLLGFLGIALLGTAVSALAHHAGEYSFRSRVTVYDSWKEDYKITKQEVTNRLVREKIAGIEHYIDKLAEDIDSCNRENEEKEGSCEVGGIGLEIDAMRKELKNFKSGSFEIKLIPLEQSGK